MPVKLQEYQSVQLRSGNHCEKKMAPVAGLPVVVFSGGPAKGW